MLPATHQGPFLLGGALWQVLQDGSSTHPSATSSVYWDHHFQKKQPADPRDGVTAMLRAGRKLEGAVPITSPAALEPEKDTGRQEGQDSAGPGQKDGTHRVASWRRCRLQVKVWRQALA